MASKTPHLPLPSGRKGNDAGHRKRFQYKLLMLYAVRAINFGYQFNLGTELSVGGNFDDLIFHYNQDQNDGTYRQQYLKAKHRLNENDPKKQITANDLLDVKNGDFGLLKYLQSYVKIRSQDNNVEHLIICTNVDFNRIDFHSNGIQINRMKQETWPKLLDCKNVKNEQNYYKIQVHGNFKSVLTGNILKFIQNCTGKGMTRLFQNCKEIINGKQFSDHTADEMQIFFNDLQNQTQFKKLLEEVLNDFLEKLVFAVKMPNENELDSVLTREVEKYLKSKNREVGPNFVKRHTSYIRIEMENWFKSQDNIWLTAEEASRILHIDDDEPTVSMNENQQQTTVKFTTCRSGKIDLDRKVFIDNGGFGHIYKCTYISDDNKETQVAVKRIPREQGIKEEVIMSSLKGHINVVKLITTTEDKDFRFYILELCRASLFQLYLEDGNPKKYSGTIPPTEDMLLQLAEGLKYIHGEHVIHRDITPGNALIWVGPEQNDEIQVLMKWADFGLSKTTSERGTYTQSHDLKGTYNWIAPELFDSNDESSNKPRGTNKSDIYSEGLVFLYILLGGKYPDRSRKEKGPADYIKDIPSEYDWAKPLIQDGMLKTKPEDRLKAGEVVEELLKVKPNKA